MKASNRHQFFHIRLTTGFVCLYFATVFCIMASIVIVYTVETSKHEYQQQLKTNKAKLQQAADDLSYIFSAGTRFALSMNIDPIFQQFLSNSFFSRQEELDAFSNHIQPMLNVLSISNPFIHGIYIYRKYESFLGKDGFLAILANKSNMHYQYNIDDENSIFVVNDVEKLYSPLDNHILSLPYAVSLNNLYNSGYSEVMGILEIQISLQDAFSQTGQLEETYLYNIKTDECILWEDNHFTESQISIAFQQNSEYGEWIYYPIKESDFYLIQKNNAAVNIQDMLWLLGPLACFSIIASAFFCMIIIRYTCRIKRLSNHIRTYRDVLPKKYIQEALFDDEIDDLIHAYDEQVETIHTLIEKATKAEQNQKQADYYAMNSQIAPHFLFNTLENIRMQIEIGETNEAGNMLYSLGQLMQYNMSMRSESTLAEELRHVQYYLGIFSIRMRSGLKFEIADPDKYWNIACPFCILQPIIENCIRHGYRGKGSVLHIWVKVKYEGTYIRLMVIDDGKGMEKTKMEKLNDRLQKNVDSDMDTHHIGLFNVNARIRYLFGDDCGVRLRGNTIGGLTCCLLMTKQAVPKNIF